MHGLAQGKQSLTGGGVNGTNQILNTAVNGLNDMVEGNDLFLNKTDSSNQVGSYTGKLFSFNTKRYT